MTEQETYGADFVAALQKLARVTVLSYADRQEFAARSAVIGISWPGKR